MICNHHTFHRGHIGNMIYQSGYKIPSIDLPVYIRDVFNELELSLAKLSLSKVNMIGISKI